MKRLLSLLALVIVFILLTTATGCAHYSGGPWMGRVIDSKTKEPIEGAVVLAVWENDYAAGPGGRGTALVDASEALTDKEGNFKIAAQSFVGMLPDSKIYGPLFTIYKPGYECFKYGEDGEVTGPTSWHVYPKGWKGRFEKPDAIVELIKANTKESRLKSLHDAEFETGVVGVPRSTIPNLMKLINDENIHFGFQPYK